MLENQSLKILETEIRGLRQESKQMSTLRTENSSLKSSLKQALEQISELNEQIRGSSQSLHQLSNLQGQYDSIVREKDEISSLLEDARIQLELNNASSNASSMAFTSTMSTLNQSSTLDSLDRELKRFDFSMAEASQSSPTKKAEQDRCEKRIKAKEFLLVSLTYFNLTAVPELR